MFMSKTGRPPLPDDERKECTFRIRMTEDDRAQIDKAANANEVAASEWARKVLLKAAAKCDKLNRSQE